MTYQSRHNTFARALADHMVKERFGTTYGTHDLASYLEFVDARQAAHLAIKKVIRASAQRHAIRLVLDNAGTLIARVPMKDPRRHGATLWAETEFATLLDLIENGADGAWCLNYSGKDDRKGYVKTSTPLSSQGPANTVTVGRLIAGAGKGRIVRFSDRNPLNLRRSNLFLMGDSKSPQGSGKYDALSLVREKSRIKANLAGANYGRPDSGGQD